MKARFLHFADCHLGYRQYNSTERSYDFARAFIAVLETAVREQVDFVILAGDLFHKRSIDALTLNQAIHGLEQLQRAGIPCYAVEGNHEHAYYGETIGWLEFLNLRKLIVLLDAEFEDGKPNILPYYRRKGAYTEPVPGLRVYGLRYYGASAPRAIRAYADALGDVEKDKIEYSIFVTHAGMEGVLSGEEGGLSHSEMAPLRRYIDYVALGHIHKPYTFDDWIYNPGSTETCSTMEASWPERGYCLVSVDTDQERKPETPKHTATLHANPRRPFIRFPVKVDTHASPDALMEYCREYSLRRARDHGVAKLDAKSRPVVELQLTGILPFDRSALDIPGLEQMLTDCFDPLKVIVRNTTRSADFGVELGEGLSRSQLERQVLNELFLQDARFGPQSERWTQVALAMKRMALEGAGADDILADLSSSIDAISGDGAEEVAQAESHTEGED